MNNNISMTYQPWGRQKELRTLPPISIDEIDNLVKTIDKIRTQALFISTYLTAGRIGEVLSLRRPNIRILDYDNKRIMLFENMKNEKNPKRKFKDLPIVMNSQEYTCQTLLNYINMLDDDTLFDIGIRRAEQLLSSINMNPHWIRHIRLTHLKKHYHYDTEQIFLFAGWKLPYMEDRYLEYGWHDLVKERVV